MENPTFVIIPYWVLTHDHLNDSARSVYGILAHHANQERTAWPSLNTIGSQLGKSEQSVRRALRLLEEAGAVVTFARFNDAGQTSNRYYLPPLPPDHPDRNPNPPSQDWRPPLPEVEPDPITEMVGELEPERTKTTKDIRVVENQRRNPHWDALVAVFGEPTSATRSLYGRLAKELAVFDPSEIPRRAAALATEWGPKTVTPTSLLKHWSRYDPGKPGMITDDDVRRFTQDQLTAAALASIRKELTP